MSLVGDRLDQLRRIPLTAVMRETGAQRDRYDKAKWHTAKGAISITGLKFMNWQQSVGGGGAIDLAMHLTGLGFPAAAAWLQRHFPLPMVAEPPPAARCLALPPPERGRLSAVKHYLAHDRESHSAASASAVESKSSRSASIRRAKSRMVRLPRPGAESFASALTGRRNTYEPGSTAFNS